MLDKILCVDDDPITLMLCKKVVERVGFAKEIITAKHGLEAIEYFDNLFEESKVNDSIVYPKLVLLDLNMPVLDGWEFLETYMRKEYDNLFSSTKFIVLSSSVELEFLKQKLIINIILIIGSAIIAGIFTFIMRQMIINVSRYIEFDLKNIIYNKYQDLDYDFYKNNRTGDLMNRISEDVSKVRMYVGPAIMYTINTITLFSEFDSDSSIAEDIGFKLVDTHLTYIRLL